MCLRNTPCSLTHQGNGIRAGTRVLPILADYGPHVSSDLTAHSTVIHLWRESRSCRCVHNIFSVSALIFGTPTLVSFKSSSAWSTLT